MLIPATADKFRPTLPISHIHNRGSLRAVSGPSKGCAGESDRCASTDHLLDPTAIVLRDATFHYRANPILD
jgi:hypothetical protein